MQRKAVGAITHPRGETITFGLRRTPQYDGTETITCDVKAALNGDIVPPDRSPIIVSVVPVFVPSAGTDSAHWLFTITAEQSENLAIDSYITDARVTTGLNVKIIEPLAIHVTGRVTQPVLP